MRVRIDLLGPLQLVDDETVVTPSAPKLRQMLALLSLQANKVLQTDQLIDELWGSVPPRSALATLQSYIYQLRKILRAGNGRAIDTTSDTAKLCTWQTGYQLVVPTSSVDAHRFEQLVSQGCGELATGGLGQAAENFRDALRLWRGVPLPDVSLGPLLSAEVTRLVELHRVAVDRRLEVDLQLNRHHDVLGELMALVANEPTNEGLASKLMIALYRVGRRSEALQVYQRTRQALAKELGLEPSPELRRMQSAVLTADPWLDPAMPAPRAPVGLQLARPSQLPPDGPPLHGRDAELRTAQAFLSSGGHTGPAVVQVVGPPGVGKTSFCVALAHRCRSDHPDGQLYLRLSVPGGGSASSWTALGGFLRALGVPNEQLPESVDARRQLFRERTADRRILVVLDDVVDLQQVMDLLPGAGGVLVASRRRLALPMRAATTTLRPLTPQQARQSLAELRTTDSPALDELVELCEGLPLLLAAAAARLAVRPHWSVQRLVERARGERGRLDELATDSLDLRASVKQTCPLMSGPARTLLGAVAARSDETVLVADAAELIRRDESTAESVLEELVELQLLQVDEEDPGTDGFRYRLMHPIRLAVRELARNSLLEEELEPSSLFVSSGSTYT